MAYDVERVRSWFPALSAGSAGDARATAYFDGPGGSQTPRQVAEAVAATMTAGLANRGRVTAAERRADDVVLAARAAAADLLGADPGGIVLGRSMTQLTYDLARTLAAGWGPGDEVVVTGLDHDANVRPWVQAAGRAGATVRWAEPDPVSAELPAAAVADVLGPRTRLVAVTGASNLVGTRPDLVAIAAAVHAAGALLFVDGVHLTPHAGVDIVALGADFFTCSPYKWLGPHCGILAAAPALLESLHPDKLLPSTDAVPERFELGTLPYELLAGTTAAVELLADLDPGATGTRRERLGVSIAALERHEDRLFERLLAGLDALPQVTLHGAPVSRTPTVLFSAAGVRGREVHTTLAAQGVNVPAGNFYAVELSRRLGLGDDGAVRAGLAPYSCDDDVDRLLAGLAGFHARTPRAVVRAPGGRP